MKPLVSIILLSASFTASGAALSFNGAPKTVITEKPETSTGLNDIFVLYAVNGVSAKWTATTSDATVTWYRYSALGGGYAEEIEGILHEGNTWTLPAVEGDMGYIVEEGTDRYYFWVVDYAVHRFSVSSIAPSEQQDCDMVALTPSGHGDRILYYTINGRQMELDRQITLSYNTLVYNEDTNSYSPTSKEEKLSYLPATIHSPAPLCDTRFTISGDRFLRQWDEQVSAESGIFRTIAVECETQAVETKRDNDNEQSAGDDSVLGGSAPCEITFSAAVTDAVVFTEWQFSKYEDFADVDMRVDQTETTYTFTEQGTTYVRFMAANDAGTCDAYGPVYQVFIGDSALQCPNAFSPGASEGVNDVWKVSYKSIVTFECHIFNRWGQKMATLTDPSQGWDGRYGGKLVPPGVYYYVIKAVGADGKKYNLSGDINIVNYK